MADDTEGIEETGPGETPEGEQTDRTDWKAEARKWENYAKRHEAAAKRNAEAAKRAKELEEASKSEVEKAREAGKAEALAAVLKDRALDRVEAKAAKLFADAEDARALLASQVDDFIDDGKVDADAIDRALADLLKRKPHLGVQGKRFEGSADGGARGTGQPGKLTRADVQKLLAEGRHAEITKAQDEGRIDWDSARKR